MLLYDVAWSQTNFECLLAEENFILLVWAAKVRPLKVQDVDHERVAGQPKCTLDHNSGSSASMSFDDWKAALPGITSNSNAAIMVPQIEA